MTELVLQQVSDESQWLAFVESSPQGTRYATPMIIKALGCKADYWLLLRNGYPAIGVAVITDNAAGVGLPMHSYYIGVMYHPQAWNAKANRRTENELLLSETLMTELSKIYPRIELSLHPSISDIRGFDWFNYHRPDQGRAQIIPQYSAQSQLQPVALIRSEARSSRRREEKYAKTREQLTFALDGSADELTDLYRQTFTRQQVALADIEVQITHDFATTVLANRLGKIAVTRNAQGEAQTAGLLLFDYHNLVHLPVVGTSDSQYGGTLLYFGMMDYAAAQGCTIMDFNGANSPARGYFKHSIGAKAQLYFHILWQQPKHNI